MSEWLDACAEPSPEGWSWLPEVHVLGVVLLPVVDLEGEVSIWIETNSFCRRILHPIHDGCTLLENRCWPGCVSAHYGVHALRTFTRTRGLTWHVFFLL